QEWNQAQEAANCTLITVHIGSLGKMHLAINQAQVCVDTAYSKLQNTEELVGHLEVQLGIDKHWKIRSKDYNQFQEEALLLKYHSVLDELEHLVVMYLFELSKLLLSGTGYKLHQQITKALQQHSEAIWNAINHYNTQVAALVPPRPKVAWKDIVEYSFLGEFDLLHQSHTDIQDANWTAPAH
ncbi:hypothetical protein EDD22DRAFT_749190, partial [Suillus occidentalis]